ncbi:MAG: beta-eliminating lyase-related protein [Peptoniphilaceae bacterium]|nr:beta-eliminating lyase-related protein [Peptoniphilaceae bacterium]MDD7383698.1 beta-eliminating lyase-related protein [Peptoniphilaceae bacterium]MDY3737903.1 beta-eliminating lyase-related protein [Peptoniphilaceae bacterium]
MNKVNFLNDYSETGCPEILEEMYRLSLEKNLPYMNDKHTLIAKEYIRNKIKDKDAEIQFMITGTQTNLVAAAAFLRPHEAIICVKDAHINVHETGSIESTGHKCLSVDGVDGKVTAKDIEKICGPSYWDNAGILCVKPKMVYISQTTEIGTHYSLDELKSLRNVCDKYGLYLYLDGARLGSSLACSDVGFSDLAKYCDSFYIGGAKNGAALGEALVIINDKLKEDIGFIAKQNGAVLAKGWILALQFEILMRDGLFEKNGEYSTKMAMILKEKLLNIGVCFDVETFSNQLFPIFTNQVIEKLEDYALFDLIKTIDEDRKVIRFVTSWATKLEDIEFLVSKIEKLQS